jgi:hypothetical protein
MSLERRKVIGRGATDESGERVRSRQPAERDVERFTCVGNDERGLSCSIVGNYNTGRGVVIAYGRKRSREKVGGRSGEVQNERHNGSAV